MLSIDISIIIATCNRGKILWETVAKACTAIENKNAEIIVVNDGDSVLEIPLLLRNKFEYFDNPKRGVSSARNLGAQKARGLVLFFIDDDMWINCEAIDWIYLTMVKNNHTGMVFNINWEYPNTLTRNLLKSKVGQYILSTGYNTMWGRMHERGKAPSSGLYRFYTIASCSLVLEKELFFRIGKYNESIIFQGEDTDLTYRLNSLSIEIFSVFDVTLFHNHQDRLNIDGFLARLSNGYTSEFKAVKNGLIISSNFKSYKGSKKIIFEFFRITEKIWIFINWAIPNISIMKSFNNRLIGILAGLQRYKAWCKYY